MIVKAKDLIDKSTEELVEELASLKKQLFEAKMNFHARKLENTASLSQMKKSIARIKTILQERAYNLADKAAEGGEE